MFYWHVNTAHRRHVVVGVLFDVSVRDRVCRQQKSCPRWNIILQGIKRSGSVGLPQYLSIHHRSSILRAAAATSAAAAAALTKRISPALETFKRSL